MTQAEYWNHNLMTLANDPMADLDAAWAQIERERASVYEDDDGVWAIFPDGSALSCDDDIACTPEQWRQYRATRIAEGSSADGQSNSISESLSQTLYGEGE